MAFNSLKTKEKILVEKWHVNFLSDKLKTHPKSNFNGPYEAYN